MAPLLRAAMAQVTLRAPWEHTCVGSPFRELSWSPLGTPWEPLGGPLEPLGCRLGDRFGTSGTFRWLLVVSGVALGVSRDHLGARGTSFGACWGVTCEPWGLSWGVWVRLWESSGEFWEILGRVSAQGSRLAHAHIPKTYTAPGTKHLVVA